MGGEMGRDGETWEGRGWKGETGGVCGEEAGGGGSNALRVHVGRGEGGRWLLGGPPFQAPTKNL